MRSWPSSVVPRRLPGRPRWGPVVLGAAGDAGAPPGMAPVSRRHSVKAVPFHPGTGRPRGCAFILSPVGQAGKAVKLVVVRAGPSGCSPSHTFLPGAPSPPAHAALKQQHPLAPCPHRQRAGQTFVAPWVQLCRCVWPRRGPAAFPWDPPVLPRAALSRAWLKSRESRGRALPQGGSVICSSWPPCAPRPGQTCVVVVWGAHTKPGLVRMTQKWGLVARQAGSLCLQTLPISGSRKYR